MNLLINFYDNFLIYYPNIFFPVLFLIVVLIVIFVIKIIKILFSNVKDFGKINLQKVKITNFPLILLAIFFNKLNKMLNNLEVRIETLFKKISKEIFIEE